LQCGNAATANASWIREFLTLDFSPFEGDAWILPPGPSYTPLGDVLVNSCVYVSVLELLALALVSIADLTCRRMTDCECRSALTRSYQSQGHSDRSVILILPSFA
jgi:hypothetical protein